MRFIENLFESQLHFFISPVGVIAFIIFYALWVTALLPSSWISMLAGFIYGSFLGSILVFFGAFTGALLTFYTGRRFLSTWIQNRLTQFPKLELIEKSINQEGIRFIILTRLSPAFPFGLLNLAYGLSNVKARDFIIGLIAILPGTFVYCSLGSLAGEISKLNEVLTGKSEWPSFALTLLGLFATIMVVLLAVKAVKKSLEEPA